MKKILVVTEVFYPEDFVINDLVSSWIKEGKQIEVLTRIPSYPLGSTFPGFKNRPYQKSYFKKALVHHIPFIKGYQKSGFKKLLNYVNYVFFSFWFLLFKGRRYEKIFIYQTGPLSNAFNVAFLKKIFKWKVIIWSQDLWPETVYAYGIKETKFTKFFLNTLVKFIYKRCDKILVSCNGFIPRIKQYAPDKSFEWIPNWTLVDGQGSPNKSLPGKFNFTFAGNIGKVQNLSMLVKGFKTISDNNAEVFFNIIGDGSFLKELQQEVKDYNIKNIVFHGRQPVETMTDYFASSDVLVLSLVKSPIYEIMIPSKFQAYLHAEKPIFSIVSGELNRLVDEFGIGFTAEPEDIDSISQGFKSLVNLNSEDLLQLGVNSSQLESKYFDKQKTIRRIFKIIESYD